MKFLNWLFNRKKNLIIKPEKVMVYSFDELLEKFPKHEKIDINKVKELLDHLYDNCKYYQEIWNYFEKYINTCFPGSDYEKYSWDSPEHKEYSNYLHSIKDNNDLRFGDWIKYVQARFIYDKGQRRTFEEACEIATNKWCEMLFKFHLQDNGAINEDHGGGFWACALGTILKEDSMKELTEEMIKNTHDNIYKYYKGHSIYTDKKDGWTSQINLYCDYGPNAPLYDILEDSGIPKKYINNICPWKTGVNIDETDNAVVLIGYQKRNYI